MATSIIRPMLGKLVTAPYAQWVETLGLQTILTRLQQVQEEFEELIRARNGEISTDETPLQEKALNIILSLIDALDFGAGNEPEVYAEIAQEIAGIISATNAKTKAQQSRRQGEIPVVMDESGNSSLPGELEDSSAEASSLAEEGKQTESVVNGESIVEDFAGSSNDD